MKHSTFTRLLPWLLVAVCPPLLGQCGGAVEHGTETGNPPVVEQQKLHIVLRDTGIKLVGDPGAVSPGASVSVSNRTSGERVEAKAGADGSVSLVVPGSLQDEYEVTVSNGAGSQTVRVTAETSAGAAGSGGSAGSAGTAGAGGSDFANVPCDALNQTLTQRVNSAYTEASKACRADSDCTTGGDIGCYYGCGGPIVSVSGKAAAEGAILGETAPLCAELNQRCGPRGAPGCPPQPTTTIGCNNGVCEAVSCYELGNRAAARVDDALRQAPKDCVVDADCSLSRFFIRCVASCGGFQYVVAASAVDQLNQSVLLIQDPFCSEFESRGCPPPMTLPCAQPTAAAEAAQGACINGQCDIKDVTSP